MDVTGQLYDQWQSGTLAAYRDSGLFSEVRPGFGETDLQVEVQIVNRVDANLRLAFLSGLTLLVIPARGRDRFEVRTIVRDNEGKMLAHTEKSENVDYWFQILLLFAMPWTYPDTVVRDVFYDLSRASIVDLRTQEAW